MTREQKIARARELRKGGASLAEIGRQLGVTSSAVFKWLNPDQTRIYNQRDVVRPGRREQKTDWERRKRAELRRAA